uniref:Uncharacterized protein n=1 Tax=Romanomermis culicivorax TaxID=13658 RepID=A0A915HHG7_ROMCU
MDIFVDLNEQEKKFREIISTKLNKLPNFDAIFFADASIILIINGSASMGKFKRLTFDGLPFKDTFLILEIENYGTIRTVQIGSLDCCIIKIMHEKQVPVKNKWHNTNNVPGKL